MSKELLQAIDQLVEKNTFSLEAVKAIQSLRDKAESLERARESSEKRASEVEASLQATRKTVTDYEGLLKAWTKREVELLTREALITKLEKESAVANATSSAWNDAFHTVFANRVTRERILTREPTYTVPQGGGSQYLSGNSEREETISREEK